MAPPSKIRCAHLQKSFADCASGAEADATEQQLGMSTGSTEPEHNSYWFTSDHLGSSAFVTDASGVAIQHIEIDRREIREPPLKPEQGREQYMAFGEVFVDQRRTGFGTPYKFNAKELDCESGYYYYCARYYDPRMARFLSVDPLASDFPSWTPYHYVHNNPLRYTDPTGMRPEECPTCPDGAKDGATHVWGGATFRSNDGSWGTDLPVIGVTAKRKEKNESSSGFFSSLWSWFSGLVSTGSAQQEGTDDGMEVMGVGGGNNTTEGRASSIVDMKYFPGTNIPISSTIVMKNLRNINSDAYNGMNIVSSLAETVDFGLGTATKIQSGMIPRKENVVDTQIWISGDFIIRGKVKSYISADGKSWGAKGTIIDTPGILKK